jgi:ADP-heptose:LPS heptosyltransferase
MRTQHTERLTFRIRRQARNLIWFTDYLAWLMISPWKFKKLPLVESVVVVEDRSMGDLLVATPVFRALKKVFGELDVLVKDGMQDVLWGNPYVDNVITQVTNHYDLGIILHSRSAGNFRMSKILKNRCRFRIGCSRPLFSHGKGLFLHRKTRPTFALKNEIEDNLDVVRTIGIDGDSRLEAYTDFTPDLKNYVVFHTHGDIPSHRWYPEQWAQLSRWMNKPVVFTGTDQQYISEMMRPVQGQAISATGTTIREYFGWIKHADCVFTVDTSAVHVASAFGTKTVALFGPGDPRIWGPLSPQGRIVLRGDCHSCRAAACALGDHRCMRSIQAQDVMAVYEKFSETRF